MADYYRQKKIYDALRASETPENPFDERQKKLLDTIGISLGEEEKRQDEFVSGALRNIPTAVAPGLSTIGPLMVKARREYPSIVRPIEQAAMGYLDTAALGAFSTAAKLADPESEVETAPRNIPEHLAKGLGQLGGFIQGAPLRIGKAATTQILKSAAGKGLANKAVKFGEALAGKIIGKTAAGKALGQTGLAEASRAAVKEALTLGVASAVSANESLADYLRTPSYDTAAKIASEKGFSAAFGTLTGGQFGVVMGAFDKFATRAAINLALTNAMRIGMSGGEINTPDIIFGSLLDIFGSIGGKKPTKQELATLSQAAKDVEPAVTEALNKIHTELPETAPKAGKQAELPLQEELFSATKPAEPGFQKRGEVFPKDPALAKVEQLEQKPDLTPPEVDAALMERTLELEQSGKTLEGDPILTRLDNLSRRLYSQKPPEKPERPGQQTLDLSTEPTQAELPLETFTRRGDVEKPQTFESRDKAVKPRMLLEGVEQVYSNEIKKLNASAIDLTKKKLAWKNSAQAEFEYDPNNPIKAYYTALGYATSRDSATHQWADRYFNQAIRLANEWPDTAVLVPYFEYAREEIAKLGTKAATAEDFEKIFGQETQQPVTPKTTIEKPAVTLDKAFPDIVMQVPDYVRQDIDRHYKEAQRLGIVHQIILDTYNGKTAQQIQLNNTGTLYAKNELIRAVRAKKGIPSQDDQLEFAKWKKDAKFIVEAAHLKPEKPKPETPPAGPTVTPVPKPITDFKAGDKINITPFGELIITKVGKNQLKAKREGSDTEIIVSKDTVQKSSQPEPAQTTPPISEPAQATPSATGSQNTIFTQSAYETALASLKQNANKLYDITGALVDTPETIKNWVIIGGYHFEKGLRDFSSWSATLLREYGDAIKPHLRAIWNTIQRINSNTELNVSQRLLDALEKGAVAETERGIEAVSTNKKELLGTKVVDEKGKPRVVYHGTNAIFEEFDPRFQDSGAMYGKGFYFTESPKIASDYTSTKDAPLEAKQTAPNVKMAYLNIRKPFDMDGKYVLADLVGSDKIKSAFVEMNLRPAIKYKSGDLFVGRPDVSHQELAKSPFSNSSEIFSVPGSAKEYKEYVSGWYINGQFIETKTSIPSVVANLELEADALYRLFTGKSYVAIKTKSGHIHVGKSVSYEELAKLSGVELEQSTRGWYYRDEFTTQPPPNLGEFRDFLKQNKFDGITHTGGAITGGDRHKVWIAFDADQIVYPDEFVKASIKTQSFEQELNQTNKQLSNTFSPRFTQQDYESALQTLRTASIEAAKGVYELAGGSRLGAKAGGFTRQDYEQAAPHFRKAWETVGAYHAERLSKSDNLRYQPWTQAMVKDLGEGIRPRLELIWQSVQDDFAANIKVGRYPAGTQDILRQMTSDATTPAQSERVRRGVLTRERRQNLARLEGDYIERARKGIELKHKDRRATPEQLEALNAEVARRAIEFQKDPNLLRETLRDPEKSKEIHNLILTQQRETADAGRKLEMLKGAVDPGVAEGFAMLFKYSENPELKEAAKEMAKSFEKGAPPKASFMHYWTELQRNFLLALSSATKSVASTALAIAYRFPVRTLASWIEIAAHKDPKQREIFWQGVIGEATQGYLKRENWKKGAVDFMKVIKEDDVALRESSMLQTETQGVRAFKRFGRTIRFEQNLQGGIDAFGRNILTPGIIADKIVTLARREGLTPSKDPVSDYVKRIDALQRDAQAVLDIQNNGHVAAREAGFTIGSREYDQAYNAFVKQELAKVPNADQVVDIIKHSRKEAAEELGLGDLTGVAGAVQKFRQQHLWTKLIVPFFPSFANFMKKAVAHTPFAAVMPSFYKAAYRALHTKGELPESSWGRFQEFMFGKTIKEMKAEDRTTAEFSERLSRMVFGSAVISTGFSLIVDMIDGKISGRGPDDPRIKDMMNKANGWKPYSVKIGDEWISYLGYEPLSTWMALMADWQYEDNQDLSSLDKIAKSFKTLATTSLENPFMLGIKGMIDAAEQDRKTSTYVSNFIGSFTMPTVARQFRYVLDPIYRVTKEKEILTGAWEKYQARVPGLSEQFLPRIDVFGNPVEKEYPLLSMIGINVSDAKYSKAAQEMVRLKINIGEPGEMIKGVNLSPREHQMLKIITGRALKEGLEKLIQTPGYKNLPDDGKREHIEASIRAIRNQARGELQRQLRFYPR